MSKIMFEFYNDLLERYEVETLHANQVDGCNYQYKIDNIPFFVQGYSYGDVVEVEASENDIPKVIGLVTESGNSTVNIIFFNKNTNEQDIILNEIVSMGLSYEGLQGVLPGYFSVNVPKYVDYEEVRHFLRSKHMDLDFREACLAHTEDS
jgi:hypothetical protein